MKSRVGDGWQSRLLGDLLQIEHGFAFKGEFFSSDGQYVVLTPGNFRASGGLQARGEKEKYYAGEFLDSYLLEADDLVVVMTDLKQNAPILGSAASIPASDRYLHNQRIGKVVNLSDDLDLRYAYYLLNSEMVRRQLRASATGSTVRHTAPGRIHAAQVVVPSITVQRKVASVLSAYDDLIANNTRRIAILEDVARTIYREWFVEFRYPGHEAVPLVESELGPIPEGWEVRPFTGVADFVNGFAFGPPHWGEVGLPIIKIKELKNGVTDDTPRNSGNDLPAKFHIADGDILFSWSADLNVYIWSGGDALLNQHLFVVIPAEGVTRLFTFHALVNAMDDFRIRSGGTTMRHIKRSALKEVSTVVPPHGLLGRLDDVLEPVHALALSLTRANRRLTETRDLLLPRLVSGEVDVSDLEIDLGVLT